MRRFWLGMLAVGAVTAGVAVAHPTESAGGAAEIPIETAKWAPVFPDHPEGPSISVAWGDPKKGPVGVLLRFPAGFATPRHVHSSDYRGVVISGEFSHAAGAGGPVALAPGSTWSQQARLPHTNTCSAAGPCLLYLTAPKGFDFTPVK